MVLENALPLCFYPIKYLNESLLPYDFSSDDTILLISTSLILICFLFLMKSIFNNTIFTKTQSFLLHFSYYEIAKMSKVFFFNFLVRTIIFLISF